MYAVGQGDSGQLGLGPRVGGAAVATLVPFPYDEYNIVNVSAGIAHNSEDVATFAVISTVQLWCRQSGNCLYQSPGTSTFWPL